MLIEDRLSTIHIDEEPEEGETEASNENPLPKGLLVTNLPVEVFDHDDKQAEFEGAFRALDPNATFNYFKSFTRARVNFTNHDLAATARHLFDLNLFGCQVVRCYLTQPIVVGSGAPHLMPPKREKQFLISPPASPPVGWQPVEEGQPIINYDILSALADLAPGEAHELHPPSRSQPGIVVHVCEEGAVTHDELGLVKRCIGVRLPQTARPSTASAPAE
ncbi:hypothetical protein HAZT_HAZT006134 [Hyalella azteca]|uniref:Calcipressin-1 n=1 Tax=Hyalella azteca TaxID=294128 RepID=A0A6A0H1A8_HYAAZ|nr:calcipressin-1 [Hyalella azteca]KAA0195774.1 hypothetical protein HAZT_HAZT006134 [Hyalella azteca]